MIDESGCDKIDAAGIKSLKVYSVMTCGSKEGVCATLMEEIYQEEKWFM